MAIDISNLHDNYKILEPGALSSTAYPLLKNHSLKTITVKDWYGELYLNAYGVRDVVNLIHATPGQITMKMLMTFADGNEHSWREISDKLFPGKGYGYDIDCWRSLVKRDLIAFSSKHCRGVKFYTITSLGREVLDVVEANRLYFRVVRWFKLDEDEIIPAMMKADLNGEEAYKDTEPETFIALLEALFNPNSKMRKVGSAYRWMNNIINLMKKKQDFYEKIVHPDVTDWLDNHTHYYGIDKFHKILGRIAKKVNNSLIVLTQYKKEDAQWTLTQQ